MKDLVKIKIGKDSIGLSADDSIYAVSLNGYKILDAKLQKKNFSSVMGPITTKIIACLCKDNAVKNFDVMIADKNLNKFVRVIDEELGKNPEELSLQLFEVKPDELVENMPADMKNARGVLAANIDSYQTDFEEMGEWVNKTLVLSEGLLKTKFSTTMWGGKEVQATINGITAKIEGLSGDLERFEAALEYSNKSIGPITFNIKSGDTNSKIQSMIIPQFLKSFYSIKECLGKLVLTLLDLYKIDGVFTKNTGYPATWFFNSSLFYDFIYNYENLIDDLIQLVKTEGKIIRPLNSMR